jgi:hypothetical protein
MSLPSTHSERWLARAVRFGALVLSVAALAIFLPFRWMDATHAWLGLGSLPDLPIVHYLTRSLAALYAFHGAIMWRLATDVRRYAPMIRLIAWGDIVFGAALFGIDWFAGMPWYWTAAEGPSLIGYAVIVLWLLRRFERESGAAR